MALEDLGDTPKAVLLYELDGIVAGRELLDFAATSQSPEVGLVRRRLANAALESMLVHARVIIEFLFGRPNRKGRHQDPRDIVPADFTPEWSIPEGQHRLDKWLRAIDAHLSHMSRARTEFKPEWHDEMLVELADDMGPFVTMVTAEDAELGSALDARLIRLRELLEIRFGHNRTTN